MLLRVTAVFQCEEPVVTDWYETLKDTLCLYILVEQIIASENISVLVHFQSRLSSVFASFTLVFGPFFCSSFDMPGCCVLLKCCNVKIAAFK